nr:T04619hypothetical protein F20O9.170 - Arabidopsis thaliana [Ipomoea batatas]GMC81592.1 T04619hypothetical protein F20O9.170 - Arabidopsis thaliana [Ipomoea batatas]GMC83889.1 T04619hypothetical protein F20O9.170 - Arabidopsis thaliana [Ipomoea batatas]GMC88228.1 T04619hypothetical protein F20O9.170 - Arabidopsis thaliana [Ipomoea batatas]
MRSLPSLVNVLCGFSSIMNTRSAGMTFGSSFPFSGNRSSRLQGNFLSIGGAFRGPELIGLLSPNELKISSPNNELENLELPLMRLPPPIPPPNGLEPPKISAKISLGFLVLNLNGVSPGWKYVVPPASGGGACPLSPSSPY